jgi:hypothetical protein
MNNNNLDIFILAYKPFKQCVNNKCYKVVSCTDETIETNLPVLLETDFVNNDNNNIDSIVDLNKFYSELTSTYWLWKNYNLNDYVGVCHYRRYFDFMDNIPNMDEIFQEHDVILPKPLIFPYSVTTHYKTCHNLKDIMLMTEIVNDLYPEYQEDTENVLNGNIFYPCNIFIMKKNDFIKYCDFIFSVVNEYLQRLNVKNMEEMENYVMQNWSDYYKPFYPNNTLFYQVRIGGFLAERLLNIFVKHNFTKVKEIPIVVTENKY